MQHHVSSYYHNARQDCLRKVLELLYMKNHVRILQESGSGAS